MNKPELRMYGLVPYNISPIQQGIQYTHSVVRYGRKYNNELFADWADNWETSIILNGGTTNTNPDKLGTLNQHLQSLVDNGIDCCPFYEPDLGDQLTCVTFIVNEYVFAKDPITKKYVYDNFEDWIWKNQTPFFYLDRYSVKGARAKFRDSSDDNLKAHYNKWVEYMGGQKNVFLREFTEPLRLA